MAEDLVASISNLLDRAIASGRSAGVQAQLRDARDRLHGPLRLAIAGKVKAGKSTLLNALLGEELAPTDAGECTKIVTWYVRSQTPRVIVHPRDGEPRDRPWTRESGALDIDLGELSAAEVDHIEVRWPSNRLQGLTIMDTPGIASISAEISERTHRVLSADEGHAPVADAVLYLLRHAHATDLRFLESFHDDELAHGTPMNAVGVLARADEIGSCRMDALDVAQRIALRYERDSRLRRLCPIVIPVDGLLAFTATTLREAEFAMLTSIAGSPRPETDELLLTADRFATRASSIGVTELERQHLLDRLGLFGIRLGVELLRSGIGTAADLASELTGRSGLDRLRSVLLNQFHDRSRVLKARSALAVLAEVLEADGCEQPAALRTAAEEITASTHEFEEVRLLSALHAGDLALRPEKAAELERLLGGAGHDAASRLGLDPGSDPQQLRGAALASLESWQRVAEHPLSSRSVQVAARGAVRTLEGLVPQVDTSA